MLIPKTPRLFIDMDGTLTEWKNITVTANSQEEASQNNFLEKLNEVLYFPGYFRNLTPQTSVIEAIKKLYQNDHFNVEIYILSCVLPDKLTNKGLISPIADKNIWLDNYLPFIDYNHRIFVPDGMNKTDFIPDFSKDTDFLLDDYTKNLKQWTAHKSSDLTGIKLLNNVNSSKGTYTGPKISYSKSAEEIYDALKAIIKYHLKIEHEEPPKDRTELSPDKVLESLEENNDKEL